MRKNGGGEFDWSRVLLNHVYKKRGISSCAGIDQAVFQFIVRLHTRTLSQSIHTSLLAEWRSGDGVGV